MIAIDYEDGRLERHFVATSVHRHSGGSCARVELTDELRDVVRVDFATARKTGARDDLEVLSKVRDRE